MSWQWPAGAACGFLITLVTTPAGVSGAVLLLPVQLSVLRVPSLAVTPTNLVFNVVAVPCRAGCCASGVSGGCSTP
jgi:uncharacterized membrane protein YfcA